MSELQSVPESSRLSLAPHFRVSKSRLSLKLRLAKYALVTLLGPVGSWANIAVAAEKPSLTRLNPAGVQLGTTTPIEATGTFKDWPVQIWCSTPEITWKCGEKPGTFEVQCASGTESSIAWVRFFNEAGTTVAKPFLIVPNAVLNETDPNDRITQVEGTLAAGTTAFGSVDRTADVDHFKIELKAGEPFYAVMDAARSLESPLDAHLQLLDSRGNVLTEDLDTYGYDPAIDYTPKNDGVYYLRVFGFPIATDSTIAFRGGGDWSYSLKWNTGHRPWTVYETSRITDHSKPEIVHYSTSKMEAKTIPLSEPFVQIVTGPKEAHFYKLPASHGKFFKFKMHAQSMGSPLDPVLSIIDSTDKQVSQVDDISSTRDPELVWNMPAEGEYWLKVTDFHQLGGPTHAYRIRAEEQVSSLKGITASELIEGKATQEFEIAVNLERIAGWLGDAEFIVNGLPEGATVSNNTVSITADGPKAHSIKIQIPTTYQGPLNLTIKSKEGSPEDLKPVFNTKGFATWLSISAAP